MKTKEKTERRSLMSRFISVVERAGNKLPDPVSIFIILSLSVVVISAICSALGASAVHPGTGETIYVTNLLTIDGLRRMITEAVPNFANFPPFAMALVVVIGSGAIEKSGFLITLMQKILRNAPPKLVTMLIIFVGVNANIAGDAGFLVLPPLAALIFMGMGRSPLVGLFAAYAAVAGGFCASLGLGMFEVQGAGFSTAAAQMLDPTYVAAPTMNYFFMVASCFVITLAGTFITERFVAPRFENGGLNGRTVTKQEITITAQEERGLRWGGIAFFITVAVIVLMCLGDNAILADPETGSLFSSSAPFMKGLIFIIALLLFVPGCVFGFASGKYKNDKDLFASIIDALREVAPYILLCFFSAQFINYFTWSNLAIVLAVNGANLLSAMHLTGIPLILIMVLMVAVLNIFMGSASAKYAILAPVIVPMLMMLNVSPAMAQCIYRIGDSITNPLSPLFSYFAIILAYAQRYDKKAGMGTMIANMLPYSIGFFLAWAVMLAIWWIFKLPLGPGAPVFLG